MTNIVLVEPNKIDSVPFTTSKIISEFSGVEHRKLKVTIRKHISSIELFGLLALCGAESTGGRPEEIYKLNEQQATFLMTLLKNTEKVVKFKVELVRQFYVMHEELLKRQMLRVELKPIRRELTDVIKENPDKGKWSYKLYTDLAYKTALGKNASQIRKERGAVKKAVAIDYMTAQEIEKVSKLQSQIAVLHEMGLDYEDIKTMLLQKMLVNQAS